VFHWTEGGKFFRFRPSPVTPLGTDSRVDSPRGIHGVRHYWLCERCSHVFTLAYEEGHGVILKLIWPELAAGETHKGNQRRQKDQRSLTTPAGRLQ
jgi:hypothetical protein